MNGNFISDQLKKMGDEESDMDKAFVKIEDVDYELCICGDKFTTEVHLLDHYSASHSDEFDNFCKIRQLKFSKESGLNINNFVFHSNQRISHQEGFHQQYREQLQSSPAVTRTDERTVLNVHNSVLRSGGRISQQEGLILLQSREQLQSSPAVKRPDEQTIFNVHNTVLHSDQSISHQVGLSPGQSRKQLQSSPAVKQNNERTPYACGVCKARFFLKDLLIEHMKDHSMDKSYEHPRCSDKISNTSEQKINLSTKQRTKMEFVCDTCGSMFRSNVLLKEHHSQCVSEFSSQGSNLPLVINVDESSNTCNSYDCKICKYQLLPKQLLLHHVNDLPCAQLHGQCDPGIRGRSSRDLPLISNVGEESNPCSYVCNVCEARFSSPDLLAQHASEHEEDPQAVEKFGSTEALRSHHYNHKDRKRIKCPFCDKKFTKQYLLTEHMRVHTGEKPFECEACGKRFSHRNALKKHSLRYHDSVQDSDQEDHACVKDVTEEDHARYKCPKCVQTFSALLRLKNHFRAQHNVKSLFTCTSCDSVFVSISELKNHYRICTPTNQFSCNLCEAKLANKNSLKVHLFKHKNGKRFECGVCEKKFAFEYLLREHLPKHTGEKNFVCDVCGQDFSYKSSLRFHKKEAHGEGSAANNSVEEELVDDPMCDIQEKEIADADALLETQS